MAARLRSFVLSGPLFPALTANGAERPEKPPTCFRGCCAGRGAKKPERTPEADPDALRGRRSGCRSAPDGSDLSRTAEDRRGTCGRERSALSRNRNRQTLMLRTPFGPRWTWPIKSRLPGVPWIVWLTARVCECYIGRTRCYGAFAVNEMLQLKLPAGQLNVAGPFVRLLLSPVVP
jgi:hypothetical protein